MARDTYSELSRKLRAVLRQTRKAAGLTQAETAERLGVPQSYVAKVEGGERRLDVAEFFDFVGALGADPYAVLQGVFGQTSSRAATRKSRNRPQ